MLLNKDVTTTLQLHSGEHHHVFGCSDVNTCSKSHFFSAAEYLMTFISLFNLVLRRAKGDLDGGGGANGEQQAMEPEGALHIKEPHVEIEE